MSAITLIDEIAQLTAERIAQLTEERDEWAARHEETCRMMGEVMQDRADMEVERDALKDAARPALDALVEIRDNGFSWDARYDKAIAALKAVL